MAQAVATTRLPHCHTHSQHNQASFFEPSEYISGCHNWPNDIPHWKQKTCKDRMHNSINFFSPFPWFRRVLRAEAWHHKANTTRRSCRHLFIYLWEFKRHLLEFSEPCVAHDRCWATFVRLAARIFTANMHSTSCSCIKWTEIGNLSFSATKWTKQSLSLGFSLIDPTWIEWKCVDALCGLFVDRRAVSCLSLWILWFRLYAFRLHNCTHVHSVHSVNAAKNTIK